VYARGDEIVPFAHAEMIRDQGGATLWELADGDHRLQTIDRRAVRADQADPLGRLIRNGDPAALNENGVQNAAD